MLPEWAQEGGKAAILQRLEDPSQRAKMKTSMQTEGFFQFAEWDKVLIADSPANRDYSGRYVADLAAGSGKNPFEWVFDALLETELQMHMIIFIVSEDNVRTQLKHPSVMIGTDGSGLKAEDTSGSLPHPRSFGTCPRILARYVRDEKLLSMEEAVHKMSGQAAERLGLKERGILRPGFKADVVIFHPEGIQDKATYESPLQYPSGIPYVLVNGEPVVDGNNQSAARPGRVVTRS
jgi:N-acyl-D-amino-acid deacylase